jgi:hypothetical protein
MNKTVYSVFRCPFDFPVTYFGIFLVIITHQRSAVRKFFCKMVEEILFLPRSCSRAI